MKARCTEQRWDLIDGVTGGSFAEIKDPVADLWGLRLGNWGSSCGEAMSQVPAGVHQVQNERSR